jgi:hypothetical protein
MGLSFKYMKFSTLVVECFNTLYRESISETEEWRGAYSQACKGCVMGVDPVKPGHQCRLVGRNRRVKQ